MVLEWFVLNWPWVIAVEYLVAAAVYAVVTDNPEQRNDR